jgi:cell division protein ZapA (FtsZ GTPase activity inhibitor)|tara:strand:- start:184 stop:462 length:279 start_codon:yes stop_codon:yes gene_type:complete
MTDKEMNKLADMIVDKLLTRYIKNQASWYTSSTLSFDDFMKHSKKPKTTEEELLGELASLMTQLNLHQEKEEYEKCAEIKRKIDKLRKKLDE